MKKITCQVLLICSIILSVVAVSNAQRKVIYYWDFNKAYPIGGAGLDSLGTPYSYTNATRDTLYAPYESFGSKRAKILYSRPPGKQTTPLAATKRDSILDDGGGAPFCYINDLHILGNDTSSNQLNNDFVRSRNPDENAWMYLYLPTTGYKAIVLNYAISASSTKGCFYNIFSYSTNGGATWNNLTTAMDTFNIGGIYRPDTLQVINPTTASSNWYPVRINFTSDPSVDNNANFVLRWQYEGTGSNGTSGNDRYDNISLVGDSLCAYFVTKPSNVVACNSGNAQFIVSVSGGTPPYSLQWQVDSGSGWLNLSNSLPYSGVHSDTLSITGTTFSMNGYHYRCEIAGTCGGNTFSSPATLTIDAPLNDSIVGINLNDTVITFCTPTSATVGANGGTSPYTYLWTPGGQTTTTVNGLGTGTYTITVTDAIGCSASTSLFVIGDTALVEITSTSQTNIECSNTGSATVTAARGIPPYTYLWTPGSQTNATATGLSAGTYTISVSDSTGCNTTASVTILSSPLIRDSINALNTQVIHYWDFNQTKPSGGGGGDSLGTGTFPLPAPYTLIPSANPRIVFSRPSAKQTSPLNCTLKDSILDNGSQGAFVNDLNKVAAINTVLGNDTNSNVANNLFVRSRNPDENSFMYMYIPTNGYKNIQLSYAISASSSKGALYNVFSYSTNGGSSWNPLTAAMDTFNTGGHPHPDSLQMINPTTAASLWYPVHINLGADTNTSNNPNLVIRWEFEGTGSNGTSGNDRYDNFSVSGTLSQEQCNGNNNFSAEAGVKYGIAPYTYSWAPSGGSNSVASNLSAGTYTVTVTDGNGCSATSSIAITQPAVLSASVASSINPLCFNTNNGTATASASGGSAPYGFRWTPGSNTNSTATGLSAGTYTVIITDLNGCTATSSVTLTSPTQLRDSITSTANATCNSGNGNVSVGVSGGTSPYTYVWSPGGNTNASANLSGGTYTVTVTDNNGCTNTATATISQPVAIRDSIITVTGAQVVIHYWDFNNTLPSNGTGADSLGTATFPLPAEYSLLYTSNPRILYSRPSAKQTTPLNCTLKDSILDNGTPGSFVNDLHILNDTATGNLFVRSRNPDENSFMYMYIPTTGYSNIQMNYAISASSTKGALYNVFSYSTNGGVTWNPLTASMDTFNTGGHAHPDSLQMINPTTASSNWYPVHIDFSSDPNINNNPNFILRWEFEGTASNGTSGNDRYDNFSVLGNTNNEICNGNSDVNAMVGVKYGTAPYTYVWSPSGGSNATASNLSAGTYTVNVTDVNGCTGTASVTITQPSALAASITPVNESCNGSSNASATINASGGTSPYTYQWTPGNKTTATITGLSIGTYTVTVNDHNLCSVIATVTITQPSVISVTTTVTAATCNTINGTATANVSGGTSPYTYAWAPGGQTNVTATGLAAGNYTVTVTDANGCSTTGTANVTSTGENVTASVTSNVTCYNSSNGSASTTVTGGTTPYTYVWTPNGGTNNTASGLSSGNYTVTVTDNNGCTSTATVTITQPSQLRDSITAGGTSTVLHYWDFNQTVPKGGGGGDSLGSLYSYANTYTVDTTNKTAPLYAPYTIIGGARIVYTRPTGASPSVILDNGSQGAYVNDLNNDVLAIKTALGNDSNSIATGNLYVRSRNPDTNCYFTIYAPTTGYQNIVMNYAISASSVKGAQYNIFSYSTNGGVTWKPLVASMDTFNTGGHSHPDSLQMINPITAASLWYPVQINFTTDSNVNNNPNFVIRWKFGGSNNRLTSGNDRYDNISFNGNAVQEICNGNNNVSLTVHVKGGASPYTYNWTPSVSTSANASNLSAGTYSVTVTDGNGCASIASLTVSQPALLTASPTETGVLCNGGSTGTASANASGGTSPYTYTWSNAQTNATATGLSAATYSVSVKDFNGCSTTASITVTQPVALRDSIAATNSGCFGNNNGTASVGVKYGTSPYTYSWSNGQTNSTATSLSAATYTVLVTDANGCSVTATTTLTNPTQLTSTITGTTNSTCNGGKGSATVSASGGTSPYTYVWNPSGNTNASANLSAGTYTVTVTDNNGCASTDAVTISQPVAIRDSIASIVGSQVVIHYWDFNNTLPVTGTGGDSLGTSTFPLPAQYSLVNSAKIIYSRPGAKQTSPLNCTLKDSIFDNGTGAPECYVNDLHILGNDSASSASGNLFVRSRNPDENAYVYLYLPTTGYSNIQMNYAISASSTKGALYNVFGYSTNGGVTWNKLTAAMDTFNTGGHAHPDSLQMINPTTASSNWYPVHIDFSSDPNINNNPNFILRWEYEGSGSNGTSGNDRYDNISVLGNTGNEVCNGSSNVNATVGVKYGTAPYTYAWSPSGGSNATASNLSAGTYTVDVTDVNGCMGTATLTITQPTAVTASITPVNESCNGSSNASATVNASGGTSPYTYLWTPGNKTTATITGLSIGSYTVTVNDHSLCTAIATVTITQPAVISVTSTVTAATCNTVNGTATANVSGGTSPYTYAWAPGGQTNATATGLAAGNYTVTVTDANGCSATGTANVTSTGENVTASVSGNVLCNGGTTGAASASVTGGTTPYTYNWTPAGGTNANASGLSAGTYTITVTDNNGCTSTATVTITQPTALKDSLVASGTTTILHYWDFNQTVTKGGNGGDSLGTEYSYANSYTVDTTNKTAPLYAPYTVIAGGARIVYIRPLAKQPSAATRDSILDNGSQGSSINDLNSVPAINAVLGNDTNSLVVNNLFVRSRNPDENSYMYLYVPTTGYQNIQINYAIEESSAKGALYNLLSYSADGGNTWNNLPRSVDTFSVGHQPTPDTLTVNGDLNWTGYNLNFSKVAAANNNANFVVRWKFAGSTSAGSSGNDRYDNISVTGNAVEELCSGGNNVNLTVHVKGGASPYTYNWTPSVSTSANASNLSAGTYSVTVTDGNGCASIASLTVSQPALLTASPTETGVLCNGGSTGTASANASGGTSPYTYTWSNAQTNATATGLSTGTYSVSVKDFNGCSATASITVTQPIALRDSIANIVYPECTTAGKVTIGVTGGTSPYTYTWSPNVSSTSTATTLSVGTYTVAVEDNNGCSASTITFTITQPNVIRDSIVRAATINVSCNGGTNGSATVGVKYGTSPYTYNWTPNVSSTSTATGLSAGAYSVSVTDKNGCTGSTSVVTITQPSAIRDSVSAITNVGCNGGKGGSATIGVKGGASPYTYSWSPNTNTTKTATGLSAGTYTVNVTDKNGCNKTVLVTVTQPTAIRDSLVSITYPVCNGSKGTATVGVKGGSSPYTYAWSPITNTTATSTNLSAGTYTVTIHDNHGCTSSLIFTVTQPVAIRDSIVTASKVNVTCNGGSNGGATVGVKYGTSPYTYLWSPGGQTTATASGLSAGIYTVTITDKNGCTGTAAITTITQPGAIRDSASTIVNVTCSGGNGGSATIGVKGGSIPYTYLWTPTGKTTATATGLTAGTYTVNVTDKNGCSNSTLVTITQPSVIRDSVASIAYPLCNGSRGSATVGVTGGSSPYTYSWSPIINTTATATNLTAGTYTVTIRDNHSCTSTLIIIVKQPTAIRDSIVAASKVNVTCNGGTSGRATIGVKYGTSPYTYSWTPSGQTTATASGLSAGTYSATITDHNGCSGTTAIVTITQPNALRDSLSSVTYPLCSGGTGSAIVGVKYGSTPYTYSWSPNTNTTASASNLSAGTYSVTISDKNGCSSVFTFTITQPTAIRDSIVSKTNVLCNGGSSGSITIGVKYGTSPYTYTWTPNVSSTATASGLSVGTYSVSVTDKNGCTSIITTLTITQSAALHDTILVLSEVGCNGGNGGSASANVSGGTSPYTYAWSPSGQTTYSATGLSAGVYAVTVNDNNGCTNITTVTITQPVGMHDSLVSISYPLCSGGTGSATIGASGGASPYVYTWSPSVSTTATATNLIAGTYTVTVHDAHGCISAFIFAVTQPSAIRDSIVSAAKVNISCSGGSNGSATIGVKYGTSPYTYLWSPGGQTTATATGLSAGVYTVTVIDANGCTGTAATTTITQPAFGVRDSIVASRVINVGCNGGNGGAATVGVKYGTAPYTYLWTPTGKTTAVATGLSAGTYTVNVTDKNGCTTSATVTITQPANAIKDTLTSISYPLCNGSKGSATVGVTGGTLPYTYSWSPITNTTATATNLSAGIYTVTVHDNHSCTTTLIFTVTQPLAIRDTMVAAAKVNVSCSGGSNGSATVGVKYGTSPYTYNWSPSGQTTATATGLSAGTYTVTITDSHGCTGTAAVTTITQPASTIRDSVASMSGSILCNGGSGVTATIGLKGGSSPYTYLWSPNGYTKASVSGLSAGVYTVTVTDKGGCSNTVLVTVTQPSAIHDSVASITYPECTSTGKATVGVIGGTGAYTYVWSPSVSTTATATGLPVDSYTVTVKDHNGCSQSIVISITQPTPMRDSISTNLCNDAGGLATVGVVYGTPAYTYSWAPSGGTHATASGLSNGTYTVTVKDANGCTVTASAVISCTIPVVLKGKVSDTCCPPANLTDVNIYPNPTTGEFTVSGLTQGQILQLYDYAGNLIKTVTVDKPEMRLNISAQPNGMYLVRILDKDGTLVSQKKIIKTW